MLSFAATLAFAGAAFGQTSHTGANIPEVLRGTGAESTTKKTTPAKPAVHKAAAAQSTQQAAPQRATPSQAAPQRVTLQSLRASRYGGFAPSLSAPPPPPPELATTRPRTLHPVDENPGEALGVT